MKRLILLAVICSFVLSAAVASAADIKATGNWMVEANWNANWDFQDDVAGTTDPDRSAFGITERADTIFEFIANENLKAVLYTRIDGDWGRPGTMEMGTTPNAIGVRRAFIDFNYPGTDVNVRAGYQAVTLPNAFGGGSLILDEEVGAAVVSGAITDNVGFLVGYARAFDSGNTTDANKNAYVDGYVAALPLTFDGISLTPFGMYAPIGDNVTAANAVANFAGLAAQNATTNNGGSDFDNAYWLGAAFTMDLFDPFVIKADLNYGKVDSDLEQNKRSGWLFDAALEYKGWDFMTPEAFFVYTSGEDDGNGSKSSDRMPVLAAQSWAIGSFFFGGDRLKNGSIQDTNNYMGFWALGLSLKDIQSFAEGLTHDFHLIYAQGTNGKDSYNLGNAGSGTNNYNMAYGRTLTEDDDLWEVDFNTGYKVYDGLTLSLDLGYLNLNTKKERWDNINGQKGGDAWKVSTGILYQF